MADDAAKVAATYFDAWRLNDVDTMRSLKADDVAFVGPLARLNGVADYMEGIKGMSQIKSDLIIDKIFVDGPDVPTWFGLHTTVASPCPSPIGCTSRTASGLRSTPANSLPEPAEFLRDGADS